ncbi:helix-turn-helix transcriptional regulator [Legionella israelensis]|uniref:helix-turn-helix transcriptional regulator n=1 Tax=Legionella israelensis TaxID=454 RepID=UPI00142F43D8|nr:LuxR C-terminal-related transcriptional regulator [Legionella israelensis]
MNNFNHMLMHSNALYDAFKDFFKNTPIEHWGYYCFNTSGHYFQVESDQHFFKDFLEKKLYLEIPISNSNSIEYQFYTSVVEADPNLNKNIYHLAKAHEYYSFVNIINYQTEYTEVITLASKKKSLNMVNYIINHQEWMLKIAQKIHEKLFSLFRESNCILLPSELTQDIQKIHHQTLMSVAQKNGINVSNITVSNDSFDFGSLPFDLQRYLFSSREKDMIYLLYYGFNTKETAEILELSRRTVERTFEEIRKKLKCKNKMQILYVLFNRFKKKT